ncbi:MAG: hypothetical protein Q9M50_07910 [Methylococcales bacterium]|nr:hypothetical protein [Methylococcales bacterium]
MSKYTLIESLYIYPTPAGVYYALSSPDKNEIKSFLINLLQQSTTPELNVSNLLMLSNSDDENKAFDLLYECQKLGWVQGLKEAIKTPSGRLEDILPSLLSKLSTKGKVLLADYQGFFLASHGFTADIAEEFSALAAEISRLRVRSARLLMNDMGLESHAWSSATATGKSQLGFWPLFIGEHQFIISILGVPYFNQPEFVSLAWTLTHRYS